ncbi:MAG: DUF1015 family protein [Planctomycetota bacterium]|nr:MAG: DUF1015 family protein [Planctomycetota bacterium]
MTAITGLVGLRPTPAAAAEVAAPPYDVIKPGSRLESLLAARPASLTHVTLGADPKAALDQLVADGRLIEDTEPAYYAYRQQWSGGSRLGFFAAVEVSDYSAGQVIRHEKVFDAKVQGRIELAKKTGVTMEPIFLLTRAAITATLEDAFKRLPLLYDFDADFQGLNDLHGVSADIVRIDAADPAYAALGAAVAEHPLYIADGHHRYHTALRSGMTHCMTYITGDAAIQGYNRVINGVVPFAAIKDKLALEPVSAFHTPPKNAFCLHTAEGNWLLRAKDVPQDVVGRLDCSILERELYPHLGLEHRHIIDPAHFDYYPESQLDQMQEQVASGKYELAVALHPVSIDELMAVADAGMGNPDIVMPEKSTFFAPKVLSGLFIYRHSLR